MLKNIKIMMFMVIFALTFSCTKINAMKNSINETNVTIAKDKGIKELEKSISNI